ncbi:putative Lon protease [Cafeteria roenbergensis virus]|uniref:Putative Lon protease n=1 Tax=Cafeteria roenbergensis virus (strain BV-PW1) TaxID=693272 RepID=E3T4F6_CROVB|nr:putative Lon protease [Cafeteria roenbergensis virus BV-PW1]ADO67069.1 putative Lon protease [Cafeteria roenbergensis virus BV-PW1]
MVNIQDFFKKLSRKRPRSNSLEENDKLTQNEYINYIINKFKQFMNKPKTYRQITTEINSWLKELNEVRKENATTEEELRFLTQKIHDVSISERIIYELLDFIKNNKITKERAKTEILTFLNNIKNIPVKRLRSSLPSDTDTLQNTIMDQLEQLEQLESTEQLNFINDEDDEDIDSSDEDENDEDEYQPGNNNIIEIRIRKNNFLQDWNKRFEEIRENSRKNMSISQCQEYLNNLESSDREKILVEAERVEGIKKGEKPMYFKILDLPIPLEERKNIIREYNSMGKDSQKIKNWLNKIMSIPFGIYHGMDKNKNANKFIKHLQNKMDKAVFGHNDTKRKIIQIMCQGIRNPNAKGLVIGLEGPPGVGKTVLIEQGICQALDRPFIPISLGGASDSSFLDGHSFTYEGSIPGKIAESLIQAKCMNPVFYFDELDKVSNTHKGKEIINLLVHLIDPSQNSHYHDKYFHGVTLDLSRATFIFSFNDASLIDHILLDRITVINTESLDLMQKRVVTKEHLIPSIEKEIGLAKNSLNIKDEEIDYLVETFTLEGGVRKLKELLFHIIRELNIYNLTKHKMGTNKVNFPFNITRNVIDTLTKDYHKLKPYVIHSQPKIGVVNGMWANSYGVGGVLPIEIVTFPSHQPFSIKKTGSLKKVIQESIEVALSVAWNSLEEPIKNKWMKYWKNNCEGFHVHCPEGAVPKDGPSAGTALSLAFYSLLSNKPIPNDISITGEINLQGNVTAIGGLKEKITGCKKAGIKTVFYPVENNNSLDKIKHKSPEVLDNVKLISLNTFTDLLQILYPIKSNNLTDINLNV